MNYLTSGIYPEHVLRHFEDICRIPHPTYGEAALVDHIVALATANGLDFVRDSMHNLLVRVPASSGMEQLPPLMIQGHTDMVCVHRPDITVDMVSTPLDLRFDGEILYAEGTSLGADNAVGLCMMLALMEPHDFVHPPLELLFLVAEEIGCVGAKNFDYSTVKSRRMINMDSGDVDCINLGNAGILKTALSREYSPSGYSGDALCVTIDGLAGGHTSGALGQERGSAIDFMSRLLYALAAEIPTRLASVRMPGAYPGSMPCYLEFDVGVSDVDCANAIIERVSSDFGEECSVNDRELSITTSEANVKSALSHDETAELAEFLLMMPYGIRHRDPEHPTRLKASSLVTVLELDGGRLSGHFSVRANLESYMNAEYLRAKIAAKHCGFNLTEVGRSYPANTDANSPLATVCREVFRELNGREMRETVIHGGMDAGFIKRAIPEMDIVGFAPDSRGAHTASERLYVRSVGVVWDYLIKIFERLCN